MGDWPRTDRWLPWGIAGFLSAVWLLPLDSVQLRAGVGFDLKLDRILLGAVLLLWVAAFVTGGRQAPRLGNASAIGVLLVLFGTIAILSVTLNADVLVRTRDFDVAQGKLLLLAAWVGFFLVVATSLRPTEVRAFAKLFYALGLLAALAAIWQRYGGGQNLHFEVAKRVFPSSVFAIRPVTGGGPFVLTPITGPAIQGLALTTMLGMAFAFPLTGLVHGRRIAFNGAAAGVILLAIWGTGRDTGTFAAAAVVLGLLLFRPKRMLLYVAPAAIVAIGVLAVLRPNAVELQLERLSPKTISAGASAIGRRADYPAVSPDIREHLLLGRGFGSYQPDAYRILDNQWLLLLIETGLLGVLAFAGLLIAVAAVARGPARSQDTGRSDAALAAVGGVAAVAVSMLLFDALAFVQPLYLFLFLAALVAASRGTEPAPAPPADAPTLAMAPVPPPRPAEA